MVVKDFEKILIKTKHGTIVPVQVIPGSKEFAVPGIDEWDGSLKVRLQKKPERGKANKELVEKLRKFFKTEVEIIAGKKKQRKKLLIHGEKTRVLKRLSKLQGKPEKA